MLRLFSLSLCLAVTGSLIPAAPVSFPSGLVPFSSIEDVTAADSSGDRLVLGDSFLADYHAIMSLPAPAYGGQSFSNTLIELAPGQFFSDVLIPTEAERSGDFRTFGQSIYSPLSGAPFVDNIIPRGLLYSNYFAFLIGPSEPRTATPEPSEFALGAVGAAAGALVILGKRRQISG